MEQRKPGDAGLKGCPHCKSHVCRRAITGCCTKPEPAAWALMSPFGLEGVSVTRSGMHLRSGWSEVPLYMAADNQQ